jgi:predicted metal-dependent enzyme (double-stranded beta helix superfamily)
MCGDAHPAPSGVDEFVLDTPRLRDFIGQVNAVRHATRDIDEILARIRPAFAELLAADDWLPAQYQQSAMTSGMGQGIGMWLLYRAGDGGLAFSALVVPPGVQTPVHDHLAWGLVGLYRGEQDEDVFARHDDGATVDRADLTLTVSQRLHPGDFYELRPENDIHRVRTVSDQTSVSLHLLGNDNGCIWRHRYFPDECRVEPFRSGYVNVDCQEA